MSIWGGWGWPIGGFSPTGYATAVKYDILQQTVFAKTIVGVIEQLKLTIYVLFLSVDYR